VAGVNRGGLSDGTRGALVRSTPGPWSPLVPVSGAGGGPAPREAFQKVRQPSPLALSSIIHFPNCSRPLLCPYFEWTIRWCGWRRY
jgi:hypothetical protein